MDCLRGSANTPGLTVATTKETLSKDWGVAMDFGALVQNRIVSVIKGIIRWTKSQDMASTSGRMVGSTRATSKAITEMGMESFTMGTRALTGAFGIMANKLTTRSQVLQCQARQALAQVPASKWVEPAGVAGPTIPTITITLNFVISKQWTLCRTPR